MACHAYDGPGLHHCIDGGVDSIEHGIGLDDEAVRKMVAKGIYLVPTLYVYSGALEKSDLEISGGKVSRLQLHEVELQEGHGGGRQDCIRHRRRTVSPWHASDRIRVDDAIRNVKSRTRFAPRRSTPRICWAGRTRWAPSSRGNSRT